MEILVLAVLWGAYLVPPLVRQRNERQPTNSVHSFKRQLRDLSHTTPAARLHALPHQPDPELMRRVARRERQRRRTVVLKGLGLALVTSAVLGYTVGALFYLVHLLTWLLAVAYVGMLVHTRRLEIERARRHARRAPMPVAAHYEPRLALQRAQ